MFEPTVAPGACRRARRPGLRLDVLRRPVGGRGPGRAGRRRGHAGCSTSVPRSSRSATPSGSARPAHVAALLDAFNAAGRRRRRARAARPRHLRPGARQRPRRAPARRDHLRRVGGRAGRLPVRRERDGQPRHRGPGLDARRARDRARRRPRPAGRDERVDGRRAGPAQSLPRGQGARPGRAESPHDSSRVSSTSGRRRRGRRTCRTGSPATAPSWPGTGCTTRWVCTPATFRRGAGPASTSPGAASARAPAASGTGWWTGYAGATGTVVVSPRDPRRRPARSRSARRWRPGRQRGPPRLLRPRPRPAGPGRVAGGDQAPPPPLVRQVPHPGAVRDSGPKPSMWFWKAQGLPDVLTRWGAGLPPERIHVVTVPQSGAPRDLLWQRYCDRLRDRPRLGPRGERPRATSPSARRRPRWCGGSTAGSGRRPVRPGLPPAGAPADGARDPGPAARA